MNLIEFKNVNFSYVVDDDEENKVTVDVLKNFNLTIEKGSFVAILGHNGSGKSTTAKLINGINIAQSGEVIVDGQKVEDNDTIFDIRRKVGMVFQNPDNQLIGNIVEEDVAFGPENMGIPAEEIEMRITKALASTGMTAYREASPGALSGGQKQKIAISGVLAMEPECIIFDEPTAMIDPESRKELLEAIYDLKRLKNITVIYITHFLQEVSQADYLYV